MARSKEESGGSLKLLVGDACSGDDKIGRLLLCFIDM